MGIKKTHGFTIIEVMLFLAITGALGAMILVSSSMSIGQQRYRDSVNTFKSFVQDQYSRTTNVSNIREGAEACANAIVVQPPDAVNTPQARGTSDCLLMGRLITVDTDGKELKASSVVGYRTSTIAEKEATDLAELTANYTLGVSTIDQEVTTVEWGASIVKPKTSEPQPLTMLIVSSPLSGSVMTFIRDGIQTDINAMLDGGVSNANKDLCVDDQGGAFISQRLAVRINAFAASQSAIEVPRESDHICD